MREHVHNHAVNGIYTCPHCPKVRYFFTRYNFHTDFYSCINFFVFPWQKYDRYKYVRKHIRACHCKVTFSCKLCKKSFKSQYKLKSHMLRYWIFLLYWSIIMLNWKYSTNSLNLNMNLFTDIPTNENSYVLIVANSSKERINWPNTWETPIPKNAKRRLWRSWTRLVKKEDLLLENLSKRNYPPKFWYEKNYFPGVNAF